MQLHIGIALHKSETSLLNSSHLLREIKQDINWPSLVGRSLCRIRWRRIRILTLISRSHGPVQNVRATSLATMNITLDSNPSIVSLLTSLQLHSNVWHDSRRLFGG
jgi:hypothetical protein